METLSYHENEFNYAPCQRHILRMVLSKRIQNRAIINHSRGYRLKPARHIFQFRRTIGLAVFRVSDDVEYAVQRRSLIYPTVVEGMTELLFQDQKC